MGDLEDQVLYSMAVGVFLPLAISALTRCHWSDRAKAVAAWLVYALAGAGLAYYEGAFTGGNIARAALLVALWSYVLYKGLYKPTGISAFVERNTERGGVK